MEHPAIAPDALVRPWRTATFVASAVAALELVVLLVLAVALLAKPVTDRARTSAEAKALAPLAAKRTAKRPVVQKVGAPRLARGRTAVLVLNGNGRTGAAASEAGRVRRRGYRIAATGNAPRTDYARSLVMYRPGFVAEARRLARDLRIAVVGPLDGLRTRALRGAQAVVIVGG